MPLELKINKKKDARRKRLSQRLNILKTDCSEKKSHHCFDESKCAKGCDKNLRFHFKDTCPWLYSILISIFAKDDKFDEDEEVGHFIEEHL